MRDKQLRTCLRQSPTAIVKARRDPALRAGEDVLKSGPATMHSSPSNARRLPPRLALLVAVALWLATASSRAQSIALPWSSHGHDPQHSGLSLVASQPLTRIVWQTPVDLAPQYSNGTTLYAHYGSPLITRQNTVIVPVKTGPSDGFRVEGRSAADGSLKWTQPTDYTLPSYNWVPSYGVALTPKNRVYFPGAGGTVYFRDAPDAVSGATGQLAFYGLANYQADPATFASRVRINTPLTSDRYGNIFFGFQVNGSTTPVLESGIARIAEDGTGTWIAAHTAADDAGIAKVVMNCAPALSNDHKTLYVAVSSGDFSGGYLVAINSSTLAPISKVRLKDVRNPGNDALLTDSGSSCPTVGPDGDVYYGVLESPFGSNRYRGWLLHFDKDLAQTKPAGAFGWDDTVSIVPSSLVAAYHGAAKYLLLTKYNNYVVGGGGGDNRVAILDPNDTMTDPQSTATVMKEIATALGPTADIEYPSVPTAVREWCVNTVAVDPFTKSAIVHSEDGKIYRWDFASNTLMQPLTLTAGIGEAYTPSVIGVDGTVYVIANAILFAIGK